MWLKEMLGKQGISLRRLGKLTGIDPATLSRLNSLKQQPTLSHLLRIARVLDVPLRDALAAAGFDTAEPRGDTGNPLHTAIRKTAASLAERLGPLSGILMEYQVLAGTEQGRTLIVERIPDKLRESGAHGPFLSQVRALYEIVQNDAMPPHSRSVAGSALLYFILEADVIPDSESPIGYVDDAIAVQTVWESLIANDRREGDTAAGPPPP